MPDNEWCECHNCNHCRATAQAVMLELMLIGNQRNHLLKIAGLMIAALTFCLDEKEFSEVEEIIKNKINEEHKRMKMLIANEQLDNIDKKLKPDFDFKSMLKHE